MTNHSFLWDLLVILVWEKTVCYIKVIIEPHSRLRFDFLVCFFFFMLQISIQNVYKNMNKNTDLDDRSYTEAGAQFGI